MLQEAVKQWELHKEDLRNYLQSHKQEEYDSYEKLFRLIVDLVLNAEGDNNMNLDTDRLTVIDNGDYQGTQLFIIPTDEYQPTELQYYVTSDYYGSCSGCDTLLGISEDEDDIPDKEQVDDYMTICLHQIQRLKHLFEEDEV